MRGVCEDIIYVCLTDRSGLSHILPFYCSANEKVHFSPTSCEGRQRVKNQGACYFSRYQSCGEHWCCIVRGNQLLQLQRYHQWREVLAESSNKTNGMRFRMEHEQSPRGVS